MISWYEIFTLKKISKVFMPIEYIKAERKVFS